jgi:hypothetical protein
VTAKGPPACPPSPATRRWGSTSLLTLLVAEPW